MPHQCTNCGHVFPDGSKEMLSGCPDCGGNKFQFKQGSTEEVEADEQSQPTADSQPSTETQPSTESTPESTEETQPSTEETQPSTKETQPSTNEPQSSTESTPASTTDPATTADPTSTTDSPSTTEETDAELLNSERDDAGESAAQSTARSDVVSKDELPETDRSQSEPTDTGSPDGDAATDAAEDSSLNELRQELNNQFESIRIVSPGQYELNLMELYDRNEYIISLREDGRYVIEVPDGWGE